MTKLRAVKGEYIMALLDKGMREDSRTNKQFRGISIKTGVLPNAEGSAQVEIGHTKVLVGIKMDVKEPMPDKPEEGNLATMAELLPLASAEYDIGPPSPEAVELARVVDRGIRAANMIDMPSLYIEEKKVWSLFLDIYVLNYDGNLFDASTLAGVASLMTSKMPKYEDGKTIRDNEMKPLKIQNLVTSCTFAKLGRHILLDATGSEESIMDTRLTLANDADNIRAIQKGLNGSFTNKELEEAMETAFEKSKDLRSILGKIKGD